MIGSERHESRRIDNQLRGRSGRQGDPGASKFFVSLEDDLMRIFGSERMDGMLQKLGLKEGEAIIHPWINKALEKAQQKVEARNYEIRKHLLKFDDVMNDQRKVVYEQRREIMSATDVAQTIVDMRARDHRARGRPLHPGELAARAVGHGGRCTTRCRRLVNLDLPIADWAKEEGIAEDEIARAHHRSGRRQDGAEGRELRPRADAHGREAACCCSSSTRPGKIISCRSIICARASICAPMPSAIR